MFTRSANRERSHAPCRMLRLASLGIAVAATVASSACGSGADGEGDARVETADLTMMAWDRWVIGIRVHFVAIVTNRGETPVELHDIRYTMLSPAGAVVDSGEVPRSYPRRIGPGESAVIGRTVTADAAGRVEDVASVNLEYEARPVKTADRRLTLVSSEIRGADDLGQVQVAGVLRNEGDTDVSGVKVAVVLMDAEGRPRGYATASVGGEGVARGDEIQFLTDADLPADKVLPVAVEVLAFASED